MIALESISSQWYELALLLGVSRSDLKKIETDCQSKGCNRCLLEALGKWVDTDINASWAQVVAAVRNPLIANERLGKSIQSNHCSAS